jgi:hypothetical protein
MRVSTCLGLCAAFMPLFLFGQGGFTNVSIAQGIAALNQNPTWGAGASFFDFDNDGWDDLSFPMKNDSLKFYRNNNGSFEPMPSFGPNTGDAKQICWFDMDNDGDRDVIITYYLAPTLLFRNDGNWQFTDITESAGIPTHPIAKTFGAACGDYDKDGFLDIYLSNYNWLSGPANWLLHNNGDGTFEEVALALGVDNGQNPSFQSAWIDYDNDTWPDIYVINDKSPKNAMFHNNGDGTFTDVSVATGTNIVADAMSNAICDFDNNGFLDIYITNSSTGNFLLANNGDGTFSDVTTAAGMSVFALTWGTTWVDHDNDLDDDAMVLTTYAPINNRNYFYQNQGDGTFVDHTLAAGLYQDTPLSYSNAKGDFNNDGYFDLAVANSQPSTCFLYENQGCSNNYFKLDLEGVVSNRDAVGTWLKYYLSGTEYVEWTMCGENYLSQDSHSEILAMGSASVIDSLIVFWPSGQMEKFFSLAANQSVHVIEGSTLSNSIQYDGSTTICEGDSLLLNAGEFTSYLWSTGDTTQYASVFQTGNYHVQVSNEYGIILHSDSILATVVSPALYDSNVIGIDCFGDASGSIEIEASGELQLQEILWSSGDSTLVIDALIAGNYSFEAVDEHGCVLSNSFEIGQPAALCSTEIISPATCFGDSDGSIMVEPCGGIPDYILDWGELDPENLQAGSFSYTITDGNGCSSIFDFEVDQPEELVATFETIGATEDIGGSTTVTIEGGVEPYYLTWNIGKHSETIDDLNPGIYTIQITDANGCVLYSSCEIELMIGLMEATYKSITAYPNPSAGRVHLVDLPPNSTVQLWNMQGEQVNTWEAPDEAHIDLSSYASASYFLVVVVQGQVVSRTYLVKGE